MSAIVEVLHALPFSTMLGEPPSSHQASHRSAPLRPSHSDAPAFQPQHTADVSMTDAPASGTPHNSHGHAERRGFTQTTQLPIGRPSQTSLHPPPSPRFKAHEGSRPPSNTNLSLTSSERTLVASASTSVQNSPRSRGATSPTATTSLSPRKIKVKSLSHIQSFVIDDRSPLSQSASSSRSSVKAGWDVSPQYEISEMPVADIIEMVAGLLTKITATNDRQHEYLHRHIPPQDSNTNLGQQSSSVLAFHGKNVPSISILSYLSRIHKYCPTTYEVFLSLLVYFDRMTERVNAGPIQSLRQANQQSLERQDVIRAANRHDSGTSTPPAESQRAEVSVTTHAATPPPSGSLGKPAEAPNSQTQPPPSPLHPPLEHGTSALAHFFVVDSFNIHRLVIAGVTCASKFFSDIFYTNSRYAKVC